MRIGKVVFQDFCCFEFVECDFSLEGLTMVEGVNPAHGSDNNGSGKSMLVDGVSWALYDRCLRKDYKGDDVVRIGCSALKGTFVEVHVVGGPDEIVVTRYRKHPREGNKVRVFVGGADVSRGTVPETNALIEQILGMDFNTFSNSVAFGAREDVVSFFSATDAQRKQILERLLGLELYGAAETVARRKMRALAADVATIERDFLPLRGRLDELLANVPNADEAEAAKLDVTLTRYALCRHRRQYNDAVAVYNDLVEKMDQAEKDFAATFSAWETERDKIEASQDAAQKILDKSRDQIRDLQASLRSDGARISSATRLSGAECPTCGQPVDAKHTKKMVAPYEASMKKADATIAKLTALCSEQEDIIASCVVPPPPVDEVSVALDAEAAVAEEAVGKIERQIEILDQNLGFEQEAAERLIDAVSDHASRVAALQGRIVDSETKLKAMRIELEDLTFWCEGFGNTGLKSFLIESEIPEINRRATLYTRRLLGDGAEVRLRATKALKSRDALKEAISIEASIPGRTKTYAGASKGQKRRLDLSLLLSFRDLVASRSSLPFDQLFADELFDGLDRTGTAFVVELLREIAADSPVFLVTHDESLKNAGDRLLRVVHDGSVAQVFIGDSANNRVSIPTKRRRKVS